jgi:hypothetical protein
VKLPAWIEAILNTGGGTTVNTTGIQFAGVTVSGELSARAPVYVPPATPVVLSDMLTVAGVVPLDIDKVAPGMPLILAVNG